MNIHKLFFHIHYCNGRHSNEPRRSAHKMARTLQHHELIFIIAGKGSITIGKKEYPVKEGMLFYIGPDVPHFMKLQNYYALTVHFSYTRVNYYEGQWDVANEVETFPVPSALELKDYYQIEDIFKKLVDCWNAKSPAYEFIARTLLQQLFIAIYQNIKKQNQNYSTSLKVEKIIKYMHKNVDHKVTLIELSEMVQLSPAYLSRVFKETTGYSVIEFFNKIKIDKAKEFIIEGNKKVREVAQALGFTDEFYFSRLFKKLEGISPSEFYSKNIHG